MGYIGDVGFTGVRNWLRQRLDRLWKLQGRKEIVQHGQCLRHRHMDVTHVETPEMTLRREKILEILC